MQLTIRDRVFPIDSATIAGGMWDPYWSRKYNDGIAPKLVLSLELQAAAAEYDEATWQPMLTRDGLPLPGRDWRGLDGLRLSWTAALDAAGEHNGCMYVFEHADMPEGEIAIGPRNGLEFDVSWRGLCDIFWDKGVYDKRVPFAATAKARFTDVILHGNAKDDAASFHRRFAEHLNPDDFEQGELTRGGTYEDGMEMAHCIFTPKSG